MGARDNSAGTAVPPTSRKDQMNRLGRLVSAAFVGAVLFWVPPGAQAKPASDWVTAIVKRDLDRIEQLLPDKNNVDEATADGRTALMLAAGEARHDLVQALVAHGATINLRNDRGGSALMYAASGGDERSVALLLGRGAEINARARNGWTALTLAAARGFDGIVAALLSHGADPNVPDIYGWTPLMRAVQAERPKAVTALLKDARTDVNVADENGQTALHHAAALNAPEIANALLASGAGRKTRDRDGRTPGDIARLAGHADLEKILDPNVGGSR